MSLPLRLHVEAQADVRSARKWYEQQRRGLGKSFDDCLSEMLTRIRQSPQLFARTYEDVRSVKIRRFPYVVHYRILPNRIQVLAVVHARRDSSVWLDRLN
jgi:plasmid stabilization system protein ParE